MQPPSSMMRLLVFLLIIRVFAAPITARPITAKLPTYRGFVVRVCAWPAHRPHREVSNQLLAARGNGRGDGFRTRRIAPLRPHERPFLVHAKLLALSIRAVPSSTSVYLSDSPRC